MVEATRWSGIRPSIHPSLLLMAVLAVAAGRGRDLAVILASVLAHELAHVVAALFFGLRPLRVALYPFGGVAELAEFEEAAPRARLITLAAGPVASFLLYLGGDALGTWTGSGGAPWLESLKRVNLGLALANLLPVAPLDGGRMLEIALERRAGIGRARRWLLRAGGAAGLVLVLAGLVGLASGRPWGSLVLFGAFLVLAAHREGRHVPYAVLRWCLRGPRPAPVGPARVLAAPETLRVRDVASWLGPGPYRLVAVVAPKGRVVALLGEGEIMQAVATGAGEARVRDLLNERPAGSGSRE
ncbi:MAG TPA: site-2 protease family protein [Limnochorda sp.]